MKADLRPLQVSDIPQVQEVEREAFPTLWPPTPFKRELDNRLARYLVAWAPKSEVGGLISAGAASSSTTPTLISRVIASIKQAVSPDADVAPVTYTVLGFVGIWLMVDEAHITGIAVRSPLRGHGLGELLVIGSIQLAHAEHSRVVTLEARVSNVVAHTLYEKYGFRKVGVRKGYYTDNREDAIIMTTEAIYTSEYQDFFKSRVAAFEAKHGATAITLPTAP